MSGETVGDRAEQLRSAAKSVPLGAANQLCDELEAVRDQVAEITGPDSDIIGQTQHLITAGTDIVRGLVLLRKKIEEAAQHQQGGGGASGTDGGSAAPPAAPAPTPAKREQPTQKTVAEEEGGTRSFPSFTAAKRALGPKPGHELHHIVEQSQSKENRSGFSTERINTTDNMIWLPVPVHRRISARYSRKLRDSDMTLRDAMNGMSWEEQYRRGLRAVRRAFKEVQDDDQR
ncbi:AHH domain-containing protein [Saccharopolyspora pogona]|uniref:AHH domain-containing protein n=1 Tax=Saccharopolyspora pogona TaxID=333966 RepID=UPI0016830E02|nr:AHH domain-containing protein [Saccharopolyspora pogona]